MDGLKTQRDYETFIKKRCKGSKPAAMRALLLIYCLQTDQEKNQGITTGTNNMGFGKNDASYLTDLVVTLEYYGKLSKKDMAILQNKIGKYWRQIMLIMKGELQEPSQYRSLISTVKQTQERRYGNAY